MVAVALNRVRRCGVASRWAAMGRATAERGGGLIVSMVVIVQMADMAQVRAESAGDPASHTTSCGSTGKCTELK